MLAPQKEKKRNVNVAEEIYEGVPLNRVRKHRFELTLLQKIPVRMHSGDWMEKKTILNDSKIIRR